MPPCATEWTAEAAPKGTRDVQVIVRELADMGTQLRSFGRGQQEAITESFVLWSFQNPKDLTKEQDKQS
jgi:hypothetical protein